MKTDDVIECFGGRDALKERLGISRQVLEHWERRGTVPRWREFQIQVATLGRLQAGVNSTATEKENV